MSEQPVPPVARKILDEYRQSPPNNARTFLNHQLDQLPAAERCPTADALLALLDADKSSLEELRASTLEYRKCRLRHIKRLDYLAAQWPDSEWVPERYKPAEFGMNLVEKMVKITKHTQQTGGELSDLWGPESVLDALCKESGTLTNKIAGLATEAIVKRPLQNVEINRRRRAPLHDPILAAAAAAAASIALGPIIPQDLPLPPNNTGPNSPDSIASGASSEAPPDIRASSPPSPEIGRAADHAARDDYSDVDEEGLDMSEDADSDTDSSVALETASWRDDDAEVFLNVAEGGEQQLHELSPSHMHMPPHDDFDDRTFHLTRVPTGHESTLGWPQAQAQAEELETGQPKDLNASKAGNQDMDQPKDQNPPKQSEPPVSSPAPRMVVIDDSNINTRSGSMDLRPLLTGAMLKDDVLHACLHLKSLPPDTKILDPLYFQKDRATQPQPLRKPSRYRKLLLPLHHTNPQHWTLAVIDTKDRHFDHYDSCKNEHRYNEVKTALCRWMASMFASTGAMYEISGNNIPCPQQEDSTSCGVFVVAFAQALLFGTSLPDVVDVTRIRNDCYAQLSNQAQRRGESFSESPPPTQVGGEEPRTSYRNGLPTPAISVAGSDTEASSSAKKRSCEDQDHEGNSNFPALPGLAASISESQKQCNINLETIIKERQLVANDLDNITVLAGEMTSQMNLRWASLEMLTVKHATIAGQHDQKRRKIESRQRWFLQSIAQRPVDVTLEDVEDLQKAQDAALRSQREELETTEQQLAEAYRVKTSAECEISVAQSTQKTLEQQEIEARVLANKMDQKVKNLERIKELLEEAHELSLEVGS